MISRTFTFGITDLPASGKDKSAPPALSSEPFILVKGFFADTDALHDFHRRMLDVDTVIPGVDAILAEAVGQAADRRGVIEGIYKYVQKKVRYVAYEEGEAGYRPDAPAEVLRKHYGDCKGMAMLLATLLNRAGLEAHVACIGTKHIPFDIAEHPSLAATNHMICIAPAENDTLYLDATYEYISSRDVPYSIQGKDAMMFTDDGRHKMIRIPRLSPNSSLGEAVYEYEIADGSLVGRGLKRYRGDMLESLLTTVNDLNRTYKDDILAIEIRPRPKVKVESSSIAGSYADEGVYELTASFTDDNAVVDAGEALYVDLNTADDMFARRIDTSDRRSDYEFAFPAKIICKSVLKIPEGYRLGDLPENYRSDNGSVELSCDFSSEADKVTMVKTVVVRQTRLPLGSLDEWNRTIAGWNEACNNQIELIKK